MLTMRFLRAGRKNQAFFRIVLTESSKPPKSGFIKILGWYNPHSKENSLKKEEILSWLDKGAKPSNSLAKLFKEAGMKHKQINFIPDTKKAPKEKDESKPKEKPAGEEAKAEAEKPPEEETPKADAPNKDAKPTPDEKGIEAKEQESDKEKDNKKE